MEYKSEIKNTNWLNLFFMNIIKYKCKVIEHKSRHSLILMKKATIQIYIILP